MKLKVFGLCSIILFFVLIAVFPYFVFGDDVPADIGKVQVKVDAVYLSSDGGTTWGDNILSSESSYIEFTPDTLTTVFDYFAQSLQITSGTYNKIKVVLNSEMKIWWKTTEGGADYFSMEYGPFNQSDSVDVGAGGFGTTFTTNEASAGYWSMNLISGRETITADFLDSEGSSTTLTISEGDTSTIRVAVYNEYGLTDLGDDLCRPNVDPSSTTRIYVE